MRKHEHTCRCGHRWVHKVGPEANHDCAKCGASVAEKSAVFKDGRRRGIGCPDCKRPRLKGRPHSCPERWRIIPWSAFA